MLQVYQVKANNPNVLTTACDKHGPIIAKLHHFGDFNYAKCMNLNLLLSIYEKYGVRVNASLLTTILFIFVISLLWSHVACCSHCNDLRKIAK